jgi:hypothetical protein
MENVATVPSRRQKPANGWMTYHDAMDGGSVTTIMTAMK